MKTRLSGFAEFFQIIADWLQEKYLRYQERKLNKWEAEKRQIIRANQRNK